MDAPSPPKVSIVLASYNEAENVVPLIRALRHAVPVSHEIFLMDDDSPDGTARIAQEAFADDPCVHVCVRTQNRGFANSIRDGIERARGDKLLVMDTDFNHDPATAPLLIDISEFTDIASASRFCAGGGMEDRRRYLLSLFYNWFLRLLLRTQVQDNLFGYFVMRRDKLLALPLDQIFYGYGDYFFRLLWFAQRSKYSIIEIPAYCGARHGGVSKANMPRVFARYTREVARLWLKGDALDPAAARR